MTPTIVVTAAVIERGDSVLVTQRLAGTHLAGCWEFPGGKCNASETLAACMARELREELGIEATVGEELFSTTHDYGDRTIELHFLRCHAIGDPRALQGQAMQWVPRQRLADLAFPPADAELIELLMEVSRETEPDVRD
jgi:mutator protein MutT